MLSATSISWMNRMAGGAETPMPFTVPMSMDEDSTSFTISGGGDVLRYSELFPTHTEGFIHHNPSQSEVLSPYRALCT
jgi:hypothetical protein